VQRTEIARNEGAVEPRTLFSTAEFSMLLDNLKALSKAGRAALQTVCGLTVTSESLSLLEQGSLTFPALGDLVISGGGLNRVHLGCDSTLCMRLSGHGAPDGDGASIERLASSFRWHLLADIAGERPRGKFENLKVEPVSLRTRGVRTFSFRFVTPAGQLFLLAEVPSRLEWEQAQGSGFLAAMAESYLPDGWATGDSLRGPQGIESFLVFLRKVEADAYLKLPAAGDEPRTVAAFLVEPTTVDGKRALKFGMRMPELPQEMPFLGTEVHGSVGLGDRCVEFTCQFLGRDTHRIGEAGELACGVVSWPEDLQVVQKRRSFRLPLEEPIAVELAMTTEEGLADAYDGREDQDLVLGNLADLSFTGARVLLDPKEPTGCLEKGQHVVCRIWLPGMPETVDVAAVVRRIATTRADRSDACEEVGLEFLPAGRQKMGVLDDVREYVLEEQRSWLARRIELAGIGQW